MGPTGDFFDPTNTTLETTGGIEGDAPRLTPEQMAEDRERHRLWLEAQGLDENGNPLPAFGTPVSQGGTATGHQVTTQPTVGTGMQQITDVTLGASGQPLVGQGNVRDSTYFRDQDTGGTSAAGPGPMSVDSGNVVPGNDLTGGTAPGMPGAPGGVPGGNTSNTGMILGQTADATAALREGLSEDQLRGRDIMQGGINDAQNMNPLTNRALTQTAANQASGALGPATTVEQSLADRGLVDYQAAQASSRAVLDKLMNGPSTTDRIGSQVLRNQLALARSAAGGAGAAQQALQTAQAQAPELQAQAAQSAVAEDLQKAQAATGQIKVQGEQALGARGQDVDVAKSNQAAAMRLQDNIAQLTGTQLNLNQQNQELLGRMITDMAKQDFDWSQLSAEQQQAELARWVQVYGIDENTALSLKLAASAKGDKGVLDYVMPIAGGLAELGMKAALGG